MVAQGFLQSGIIKNININVLKTAVRLMRMRNLNLGTILSLYARGIPDRIAIIEGNRKISYHELNSRMNRIAHALLYLGINPGDRLILMITNSSCYIEFFGAVNKIGCVLVPVSTSLKAGELAEIMVKTDSRAIMFSGQFLDLVREAVRCAPSINPSSSIIIGSDPKGEYISYAHVMSNFPDNDIFTKVKKLSNPVLLHTSGTTGPSSAVISRQSLVSTFLIIYEFRLRRKDIFFTPCPFYHAGPLGFIPLCLLVGAVLVIDEKFDAINALKLISRNKVTLALMVPTHYQRILSSDLERISHLDFRSLRGLISTGSHFDSCLKTQISEIFGNVIYDLYGAAEIGMVLLAKPEDVARNPTTNGRTVLGNQVLQLTDEGKEAQEGQPGELYVKSRNIHKGYLFNGTSREKKPKGYYSAGDIAQLDADGYYTIVGRKTDIIISGGVNIYPQEIENVLLQHPAISDAAVLGIPDEEWGEITVAFVVVSKEKNLIGTQLQEFVEKHLADYKKPKSIRFIPELPYNPQGKVLKSELRKRYESDMKASHPDD